MYHEYGQEIIDQNLRSVLPVVIKTWGQDLRPTFFFAKYSLILNIMEI